MSESGVVLIITGPSGCGKTTVYKKLLKKRGDISFSVSYTTRKRRKGETHGVDYYYIPREEFKQKIGRGEFIEWAQVHGDLKGTERRQLEDCLKRYRACLLDIDVQGAMQIMEKFPSAVTIFIEPPSIEELRLRLEKRGTETREDMHIRLINAQKELEYRNHFHYIVVNDRVDDAVKRIGKIVDKELNRRKL